LEIKRYSSKKFVQCFFLYHRLSQGKFWMKSNFWPLPQKLKFVWYFLTSTLNNFFQSVSSIYDLWLDYCFIYFTFEELSVNHIVLLVSSIKMIFIIIIILHNYQTRLVTNPLTLNTVLKLIMVFFDYRNIGPTTWTC
jgi:hypothetical protein